MEGQFHQHDHIAAPYRDETSTVPRDVLADETQVTIQLLLILGNTVKLGP